MPAQFRQVRAPRVSIPGNIRCWVQDAHVPYVVVAFVKQGPQMRPSGQFARYLRTSRWQRAHGRVPVARGRPCLLTAGWVSHC